MNFAQEEAHRLNHDHVGTADLLLGLMEDKEDGPGEILTDLGVATDDVRQMVLEITPMGEEGGDRASQFTAELKRALELALRESIHLGSSSVDPDHLLIGLLRNSGCVGTRILASLIGDLNLVRQELIDRTWWWAGRVAEEDGVEKRILEHPNIRPLDAAPPEQIPSRPKKQRSKEVPPTPEWQPIRPPDFRQLVSDGIEILDHGLPKLPKALDDSKSVPVAYWKGEVLGTVLFLYYRRGQDGSPHPCGFSGTYVRGEEGWQARERWSPNDGTGIDFDPIASSQFEDHGDAAIHSTGSRHQTDPAPDEPAILISGRHSPEVAEIRFVQGDVVRTSPANGHFGFWTICTDAFEPFRIEGYDNDGALIGFIDEPLTRYMPAPVPLEVLIPTDLELPHQYGGIVRILKVERHEESVKVEWHVTLEPDPDVQLADQLEAVESKADEAWSLERLHEHVRLIDVLKLTVFFGQLEHLSLADDLGTVYQMQGGGGSTGQAEGTWDQKFEPAIPNEATMLTVHWEDLTFEVPLP